MESKIVLTPSSASILLLEHFILSKKFYSAIDQNKMLLIFTEIFENIIVHNKFKFTTKVVIKVSVQKKRILFRYWSQNFYNLLYADGHTIPWFDTKLKRYRGLGLRMCRNMASQILYKKGLLRRTITIIL